MYDYAFVTILLAVLALFLLYQNLLSAYKIKHLKKQFNDSEKSYRESLAEHQHLLSQLTDLRDDVQKNLLRDSVTELPARQIFENHLQQVLHESERYHLKFAVLFLNINRFKAINAALGFEVGDTLLKEIGHIVQRCIRKVDIVSRFYGNEFVFVVSQLNKPEAAAYIAKRILDELSKPFHIMNHELFITSNIGIAVFPQDGIEVKTLLKNADTALQQAKSRGPNIFDFYSSELYNLSRRELVLTSSLGSASIFQDFSLHYQPQMDVTDNSIVCMEALLRWQHPDFGLVAPGEFLRFAENSGKILDIGEWVLQTACKQFKAWQSQGFKLKNIAVNISFRQLESPHFSYKVSQLLHDVKMSPECLVLEVTETELLRQIDVIEKNLHMLKHAGVQIAIDDFGTSNMSLLYLSRLLVSQIKIDRTLVQEMMVNSSTDSIVKAVVALAKSLDLTLVAEGVETEKQKEHLLSLGCTLMQGYLFGAPQPATDYAKLKKALEKK